MNAWSANRVAHRITAVARTVGFTGGQRFVCCSMPFYLLIASAIFFASTRVALAQANNGQANGEISAAAAAPGGNVRESWPDRLFKMRDADGNLIVIPDLSLERWQQFLNFERNLLPAAPPAYQFVGYLKLVGEVHESHAVLHATCTIRVNRDAMPTAGATTGWIRIPMRLDGAILMPTQNVAPSRDGGAGEFSWSYEDHGEGHIAWLLAAAGSEHRLRWSMKLPIVQQGAQNSISLKLPAVPTSIELEVPERDLHLSLGEDSRNLVTQSRSNGEKTSVTIEGLGGGVRLSWWPRDNTPPLLEAKGTSLVRLIGTQLETWTTLEVGSFRGPITEFFVRLPPGTELIPSRQPELTLEIVDPPTTEENGGGDLVRVGNADGSPQSEFEVALQTLRPLSLGGPTAAPIETAGFEVINAGLQSGEVEFQIDGDWNVDWELGPYVRQVLAPPGQNAVARFIYNRQPYSLVAQVGVRESRISVDPNYVLDVNAQRVRLEGRLSYRIRGARARELRVELPGWDVDDVSPADLVSSTERSGNDLIMHLSSSASILAGDFELRLTAHQVYDASQPLSLQLPKPLAESSASATVAVISADNVRISPLSEQLKGLVADSSLAELSLPSRRQRPLSYRADSASEAAEFSAEVAVLEQAVSVSIHSEIVIDSKQISIHQQLEYRIEYEPLRQLSFDIPSVLATSRGWEVTEGDIQLGASLPAAPADESSTRAAMNQGQPRRLVVDLREDRIGTLLIDFRYRLPIEPGMIDDESKLLEILLVQPTETVARVEENTLLLDASREFEVELSDENWELVTDPPLRFAGSGLPLYRVPAMVSRVAATVDRAERWQQSTTQLSKVWLQTWRTNGIRRDRVCYQLLADDASVEFVLPANIEEIEVAVDGQRQATNWSSGEQLHVDLPRDRTRQHTIELWYFLEAESGWSKPIRTSIPRLAGVERANRVFWQVVVPDNEHLLWPSKSLTSESTWSWQDLFWARVPSRNQAAMEELVGASIQPELPAATNQYLFSSTGPLRTAGFVMIDRSVLAVWVSAVVLCVGLLFIFASWFRHPAVLLICGSVSAGASFTFPGVAILVTQAAVLGCLLVVVSRLLQWTISIRPIRRAALLRRPSQLGSAVKAFAPRSEVGSSKVATTVAPMAYQIPSGEPDS